MFMPRLKCTFWLSLSLLIGLIVTFSACSSKVIPAETAVEAQAGSVLVKTESLPEATAALPTSTIVVTPDTTAEIPETLSSETFAAQAATTNIAYSYPESFYITGIVGHVQVYELGCEASAAVDWAKYFDQTIYEFNFQAELPVSDNPDFGYVGDPNADGWGQIPPYAYGVHSDPLADLLVAYGLPAQSKKSYTLEEIRGKISQSKPVIVWIIGNMEYSVPVEYTDSQGRKSVVAPFEHVVILTGYDQYTMRYMSNGRFYDVPNEVFLTSWGVLGDMAVVYE
jgi:uncharacterized protein YvpB